MSPGIHVKGKQNSRENGKFQNDESRSDSGINRATVSDRIGVVIQM